WGALNVTRESNRLLVSVCPVRPLRDKLRVFDGKQLIWEHSVDLKPLQPITQELKLNSSIKTLRVSVGEDKLSYVEGEEDTLSRPTTAPSNFDWKSVYGLYLKGKENGRQRAYQRAWEAFRACLALDPNFAPALVEMASLENRHGHWPQARALAQRALSIDTY